MVAYDWLPIEALTDFRIEAKLNNAVTLWSAQWFPAGKGYALTGMQPISRDQSKKGLAKPLQNCGSELPFSCTEIDLIELGKYIVDAPDTDAVALSAQDRELVQALAEEAVSDLSKRLLDALDIRAAFRPTADSFMQNGGIVITINGKAPTMPEFTLALPAYLVVGFRKALIGSPEPETIDSQPVSEALSDIGISFAALLGGASLSFAELRALGEGDVIVLDTRVEEQFPLETLTDRRVICGAKLLHVDGRLQVVAARA